MPIFHDYNLTDSNTFGVNATAKEYFLVRKEDELPTALSFLSGKNYKIIGGGSNILLENESYDCVIKIALKGIKILEYHKDSVLVEVGAGENWHGLVLWAINNNFGGIENLALIPGTVGAAPIQNIGAYGVELSSVFVSLQGIDTKEGNSRTFKKKDCNFGYRRSIFKEEMANRILITKVQLRLSLGNHVLNTNYGAIQEELLKVDIENAAISDVCEAVIRIRQSKLPNPRFLGNAGSFFKNPIVSASIHESLITKYPNIPSYPLDDKLVKIPAGWLIEQAGFKGKQIGKVSAYEKQSLVLVNHGGATGEEIRAYSKKVIKEVKRKFGITLEPEVTSW